MLTKTGRLIYAMGRLGSSALLSLIDLATFWFYLDFLNLSGLLTGTAFVIGKLVIAFFGWYFGYLSDITKSKRWGRRKPYIAVGSPLLAFSTIMLFVPQYIISIDNTVQLFIYGTFFLSLANLSYGLLSTPYIAWLAEIADPRERVAVSAYQNVFSMLAQVVGTLLGFALPGLLVQSPSQMLSLLVGLGIIEVLLYVPAIIRIRETDRPIPRPSVRRELAAVLENKNYRSWLILQGLMAIPTSILASLILSYTQKVLGMMDVQYMMAGGLLLLITMIFFFVWTAASRRWNKKRSILTSLLVLILSLPLTLVIGQPFSSFIPLPLQAGLFVSFIGIGLSGWYLLPNPVTADMAQEDEARRGEARAGSYIGLISVPLNILQALARFVAGLLADLPQVPGQTYSMGLLLWGPLSSLSLILGFFFLARYVEADPLERTRSTQSPSAAS